MSYDVQVGAETGENDERQYFQKELSILKSLLLAYKRNEMQNFGKLAGIARRLQGALERQLARG